MNIGTAGALRCKLDLAWRLPVGAARMHVRECMCANACARALIVACMLADSLKDSAWQLHGSLAVQLPSAVAAAKLLLAYLWQRCFALKC